MTRIGMIFTVVASLTLAGCGNPQTVSQKAEVTTPTAPADGFVGPTTPSVQQASGRMSNDFQQTPSGLKYKIVREGDMTKKPSAHNTVLAHYKGWLDDGTIFDSSYDRGEPTEFPLNGVIGGWTEGLQLIGEGGEIELLIPGNTELGYGRRGMPQAGIKPNATLHFKVELVKIR